MVEIYWTRPLVEPEVADNKKTRFHPLLLKVSKVGKVARGVCGKSVNLKGCQLGFGGCTHIFAPHSEASKCLTIPLHN